MSSGYDKYFKTAKLQSALDSHSSAELKRPVQKKNVSNSNSVPSSKRQPTKNNQSQKRFPVAPMFLFLILLSGLGISIQYLDQIESFLSNMEISMSSALAEGDPKVSPPAAADAQANLATTTTPNLEGATAQVASGTADDSTDYLFKLAARKKELDQREAELVRREEQVTKLKEEVESKLKEIQGYRNNIAVLLQDRVATDSAKVDTLVQVYSNMKPSQAAKVFETMDEDLVIEILSKMKKKNAADILNLVKADKAQVLAEKYAGYRLTGDRKTASEDSSANQMDSKNSAQSNSPNQKEDSEE